MATAMLLERWGCVVERASALPVPPPDCDVVISDYDLNAEATGAEWIGAKGRIFLTNGKLQISTREKSTITDYSEVDHWKDNRLKIIANFVRSIQHKEVQISPAVTGNNSLELVFAIWQSTWKHQWISFPLDREEFAKQYKIMLEGK